MRLLSSVAVVFTVFVSCVFCFAQDSSPDVRPGATSTFPDSRAFPSEAGSRSSPTSEARKTPQKSEWIFAPIPFSNQAFAFGIVPIAEYLFPFDKNDLDSPRSTLVLAGLIAERKSWALGGGGRLYLNRDRFRIAGFGGHGSITYEIFGKGTEDGDAGRSVLVHQSGDMVMGEVLVRLFSSLYAGPRYNYRNLTAELRPDETNVTLPPGLDPDDLGARFRTNGPGVKILYDNRSSEYFPRSGGDFQFVGDFYGADRTSPLTALNKSINFQTYQLSKNHFFSFTERDILAVRGMMCDVEGDPPFYELCLFGAFGDIRGYQPGRYRDRLMFATQAEYRRTLGKRWGAAAFFGIGEVAPAWSDFNTENLLPGGGVGARFNLAQQDRINLRADVSYGKSGWSWVFALGEAF